MTNTPSDPQATNNSAGKPQDKPLTARLSTIMWGVILIGFACSVIVLALNPGVYSPGMLVTGGFVLAGLLLVSAGIASAVRQKP